MTHRAVIVDTDTGIDDAHALLYLAGRGVRIEAITTIFGNATTADVVPNVRRVLDVAGLDVPVAVGAAEPIAGTAHIAHFVHGRDGLGDLFPDKAPPRTLLAQPAHEVLLERAHAQPGELDLLLLGPLTNVGLALQHDPELLLKYRQVVVMGGAGAFAPPGAGRGIDPNSANDVEAARLVWSAPVHRRVMVGGDVTRRAIVDEAAMDRLGAAGTPVATFTRDTMERYMLFYRHLSGRRTACAHDALAAAVMLDPELVTQSWTGPVNVLEDGSGVHRAQAMVTADGAPPVLPVTPVPASVVCRTVDVQRFLDDFLDVLTREA